jgi:hypothetical protein
MTESQDADPKVAGERLVFVGGLHRSGTTPLARALAEHPAVSGLSGTGVAEDEGQHLQDVYPRIRAHGGMGRFARKSAAHLTEASDLATAANAERLLATWRPHWDLQRTLLLEKSPANLIMGRFLQALFPGSALIVVIRHPVVTALALEKWNPLLVAANGRRRTTLAGRVGHWLRAHEILRDDLPALTRTHLLRYEDLVDDPTRELAAIQRLLGLESPIPHGSLRTDRTHTYVDQWQAMARGNPLQRLNRRRIIDRFGEQMLLFGYDPETLDHLPWHGLRSRAHGG